ncbi:rab11 family-interacting protein 1 isoform X2 [Colossoma macropomum]|uniref:rab11 family-interacting protein 1 isoform X2 n=1 Tax=Colossoma macropomum TaxID=42526 RepID=UPI0018652E35|nr:rab11 family-interacting protein 1 isoform X2 [Colossoma macropomum]
MLLADQSQQWLTARAKVSVLQARGLRIKGKLGTDGAHVLLQVGSQKFSTPKGQQQRADPVWEGQEAAFELTGFPENSAALRVQVLQRALVGPDKLLGQTDINLGELYSNRGRDRTEWFKLFGKPGKPEKDRGEILLDIQFLKGSMSASMFDLSSQDKSRSKIGKLKDKLRGKKKEGLSDSASAIIPSVTQVMTDSEGEEEEEPVAGEKKKKNKLKSLFVPKSSLQRNTSQSMSTLSPFPERDSAIASSSSSGLNMTNESPEGKKKFKLFTHKRNSSTDSKVSQSGFVSKQSSPPTVCINGSHVYSEEPETKGSSLSLTSSGHGSMEELRREKEEKERLEEERRRAEREVEEERRKIEEERKRKEREEEEQRKIMEEKKRMRMEREKEEQRIKIEEERKRKEREEEKQRKIEEEKERMRVEREKEEQRRKIEEERKRKEREEEEQRKIGEEKERMRVEREKEEQRRKIEERTRKEKEEEEQRKIEVEKERMRMEREKEEQRRKIEEERKRKEREAEEQRRKLEEEVERERKRVEEERRLAEEKRKRTEEEERLRDEERRRMEMERRLAEEKKVREEEERRRRVAEEAEKRRREAEEESERKRKEEEERRAREEEERKEKQRLRMEEEKRNMEMKEEEEKRQKKERETKEAEQEQRPVPKARSGKVSSATKLEEPQEELPSEDPFSTNPFELSFSEEPSSTNAFEEPTDSQPSASVRSARVSAVKPRQHAVKPLNAADKQSDLRETNGKAAGASESMQPKTEAAEAVGKGPYSQLTRAELISLVIRQQEQLSQRDSRIMELEQYIDNLLVRVMEEHPSILMSINSMKKAV